LAQLVTVLGADLDAAVRAKMALNEEKYPVVEAAP
jgi:hypothetical protein